MLDIPQRFLEARARGARIFEAEPARHDEDAGAQLAFARSVASSMRSRPRSLDCRYLYDAEGSRIFEEITALPEYYPTRTEASILTRAAPEICAETGEVRIVELGSGYSVKTEALLSSYEDAHGAVDYVPLDVSRDALENAERSIAARFPRARFTGVHGSYDSALPLLRQLSPSMVVFLGSTIGNFDDASFDAFWEGLSAALAPGDHVLLGADLVKDEASLVAAYDDAAGVTARFTKNLFARMNRELGAGLDLDAITHVARWNAEAESIEIHARFERAQTLRVAPLDLSFEVDAGEELLVEISRKFRVDALRAALARHGLTHVATYSDAKDLFAVLLLRRVDG